MSFTRRRDSSELGLDVHLHFQHFPMSTLIGSYANDESCLLQFAQSTLDGGLRHAYQFSIGCIRKHTVIHNCLIELLSYRVSEAIYRVSEAVYRVRIGVYRVRSLRSSNLFEYFSQLYEAFGESHGLRPCWRLRRVFLPYFFGQIVVATAMQVGSALFDEGKQW